MNPIDYILAVLPQLSEKERDKLIEALKVSVSVCDRTGHKFVNAGEVMESIWKPPKKQFICTKCGLKISS